MHTHRRAGQAARALRALWLAAAGLQLGVGAPLLPTNASSTPAPGSGAPAPPLGATAHGHDETRLRQQLLRGYSPGATPYPGVVVQSELYLEQLVEVNTPLQTFTIRKKPSAVG
jgi:hypothetical protein